MGGLMLLKILSLCRKANYTKVKKWLQSKHKIWEAAAKAWSEDQAKGEAIRSFVKTSK
jgi:hypothetical protein